MFDSIGNIVLYVSHCHLKVARTSSASRERHSAFNVPRKTNPLSLGYLRFRGRTMFHTANHVLSLTLSAAGAAQRKAIAMPFACCCRTCSLFWYASKPRDTAYIHHVCIANNIIDKLCGCEKSTCDFPRFRATQYLHSYGHLIRR